MYAFGAFEFDPHSHELRRGGVRIKIQDQPFLILAKLLEHPGQLVTRDELRSALWSEDTFVDFDVGLNSAVKRLREALGDSAEAPAFIETLPKLGYRFVAKVEVRPSQLPRAAAETKPTEARNSRHWRHWAAATALSLAGVAVMFFYFRSSGAPPTVALEVVPLTGMPDIEDYAAFSSDGNHVAFVVSEPADRAGLYITVIGGEKPLRLTADPNDCCPEWSPDGRAIAFAHLEEKGSTIYKVPALGGTPRVLTVGMAPTFSWSPDGTQLAVNPDSPDLGWSAITLVSLEGGVSRPITLPPSDYRDWCPAFSPDGKSIAFLRSSLLGMNELYTVPVTGGPDRRLTFDNGRLGCQIAWTPDSRDIVFASGRAGAWTLWHIPASGGNPQRVEGVGTFANHPAIALNGQRLAYTRFSSKQSFERVGLIDPKHIDGPPKTLLSSKGGMGLPSFSPDGSQFAFESTQSGYNEIWTAASDGSSPRQLTFLRKVSGTPHWSYDGRLVAFDYPPAERR